MDEARLTAKRQRAIEGLPPVEELLRGTVLVRDVRCGKATCRCVSGDQHRITYLTVTFAGGRTEQISLPPALVPLAKRWVANYRRWWQSVERVSAINRQILRLRRGAGIQARRATPKKRGATYRRRRPRN